MVKKYKKELIFLKPVLKSRIWGGCRLRTEWGYESNLSGELGRCAAALGSLECEELVGLPLVEEDGDFVILAPGEGDLVGIFRPGEVLSRAGIQDESVVAGLFDLRIFDGFAAGE